MKSFLNMLQSFCLRKVNSIIYCNKEANNAMDMEIENRDINNSVNDSKTSNKDLNIKNKTDMIPFKSNNFIENITFDDININKNNHMNAFTFTNPVTDNTRRNLKEFDTILNNYIYNIYMIQNSNTKTLFDLDELDSIIDDIKKSDICTNTVKKNKNTYESILMEHNYFNSNTNNDVGDLDKINYQTGFFRNNLDPLDLSNTVPHNCPITNNNYNKTELKTDLDKTNHINRTENIPVPTNNHKEMSALRKFRKPKTNIVQINETHNLKTIIDFTDNDNALNFHYNNLSDCKNENFEATNRDNKHNIDKFKNDTIIVLSSDDDDALNENVDTISISSDDVKENNLNETADSDCSGYHSSDFEFINEDEANIKTNINFDTKDDDINDYIILDYFKSLNNTQYSKDTHKVPESDDYLNLFGGNNFPLPIRCLENKAVNIGISMNLQDEAVGFDMRVYPENPEIEAFKKEASDCERKILSLYPNENRRKRRRRY